jgi:hypothetical protein
VDACNKLEHAWYDAHGAIMKSSSFVAFVCLSLFACTANEVDEAGANETSADGNGDGDGDPGDGDGDPSGDGDGDPSGDGDGDPSGDGDGDPSGDGDGDGDLDCTGPNGTQPLPPNFEQPADPKAPGSTWAYFELEDFQPQSCNFGEVHGLQSFAGEVTLVTLMRSTCEICQGTLVKLEEMQLELTLAGYTVYFVAINQAGYDDSQQEMIDRASFPLLQDTAEVNAWDLMNEPNVGTDDMYIYGADGLLHSYFNYGDANPNIDLETPDGWATIYDALIAALES